ncbi:hypothetical protein RFI_29926 [Reticulomyxa filosa]|uniref:Uncharacterized protein n=1 Tax=Reticulomyxa filosa TaxID=46433 RepID=X6M1J8_RETFI|nr:hypothetical protein RFI_29926 [Reticulomyxa filosa]|eukprot:ETO07466.1 hypothetical protein RFI_29926 [Reticulomyxa filosa]
MTKTKMILVKKLMVILCVCSQKWKNAFKYFNMFFNDKFLFDSLLEYVFHIANVEEKYYNVVVFFYETNMIQKDKIALMLLNCYSQYLSTILCTSELLFLYVGKHKKTIFENHLFLLHPRNNTYTVKRKIDFSYYILFECLTKKKTQTVVIQLFSIKVTFKCLRYILSQLPQSTYIFWSISTGSVHFIVIIFVDQATNLILQNDHLFQGIDFFVLLTYSKYVHVIIPAKKPELTFEISDWSFDFSIN